MKVILSQDMVSLGEEGDIREVATGYARNYLIPKGLAVAYSAQNLETLKSRRKQIDKRKDDKRQEAMGVKERLEEQELSFVMPAGDSGKLFGSVNAALIGDELAKLGFEIERKRIDVPDNHIRMVGDHAVKIRLYGKEVASVKVTVEAQS